MNCKHVKTQLALLVGSDLEPSAAADLHKHLETCGDCRRHFQRLSTSMEAVQASPAVSWNAEQDSLWPKLSARLAFQTAGQKPHRMSGWAPTLAVAAVCTAMFFIASHQWGGDAFAPDEQLPVRPVQGPPLDGPTLDGPTGPRGLEKQPRSADDESDILVRGHHSSQVPVVPVGEPASK